MMEWRSGVLERLEEIRKVLEPYVSACESVRRDCDVKKMRMIIESPFHNEVRTIEHLIDKLRNHINSLAIERKRLMIEYITSAVSCDDLKVTTTFNDKKFTMTASVTIDFEDNLDRTLERSFYQLGGGLNRVTIISSKEKLDAIELVDVEWNAMRDQYQKLHHQLGDIQTKMAQHREDVTHLIEDEYILATEKVCTEEVKDALNELIHIAAEWNAGRGTKCEACGNVKRMSDTLDSIGVIQEHILTDKYNIRKLCPK